MSAPSSLVKYPGAGCIVEFMQGNRPHIAWVQDEQSGKLRLFTQNKRETKLGADRVLPWSGPQYDPEKSRQEILHILAEHEKQRSHKVASLNALEIWELVQGELSLASAQWFAELLFEAPDPDTIASVGRALIDCKTHFKLQQAEFEVYPQDKAADRVAEQEERHKRERLVSAGHEFLRALWDTHQKKQSCPPPPQNMESAAELETLLRSRIAEPDGHETELVWRQIAKGLPDIPHLPLLLAQAWGIVPAHHNAHLDRAGYDTSQSWHETYADTLATLVQFVHSVRQPPVPQPFISIDAATTRDIDDAFYIEATADGYRVWLAIACPALGWPFGSGLDKAVLRRGTSIYLPEGDLHMLPEELGTDFFSLQAGKERPALIICFDLDTAGAVHSLKLQGGWVQLAANLNYIDCEAVIQNDPGWDADNPAADYAEQIRTGSKLAKTLLQRRVEDGAVVIERPDAKLTLHGQGADIRVDMEYDTPTPGASLLVSELMILANGNTALWAKEQGIALLHRTQDVAIPKEYAGIWRQPHEIAQVVKALAPAVLEAAPRRHAGLGVDAYSPMTSPLRRYPDLVNVAQLVHYADHATPLWTSQELEAMLPLLNTRLDAAAQVQRFRPRYWKLLFFKQKGDQTWWDAVVTDENDAFVTVALPEQQIFVRGRRASFGDKAHPGTRLMVRIGKVHPLNNEIQILDVMEQ